MIGPFVGYFQGGKQTRFCGEYMMYKITHSKFIIKFTLFLFLAHVQCFVSVETYDGVFGIILDPISFDIHSLSLFHIDVMVRARCQLNTCLLTVA